ncbi:MAG: NAD(P)H-dependent oxidoreductase subunit E [Pseudomonadota bacterium]
MEKDIIRGIIKMHHHEKQAIQAILLSLQERGFPLDKEVLQIVADEIGVPLARIYGIATFYDAFEPAEEDRQPVCLCNGLSCYLQGGERLYSKIENFLEEKAESHQREQSYHIKNVSCLGCCAVGPNMMVHNRVYANPTIKTIKQALRRGQKGGTP